MSNTGSEQHPFSLILKLDCNLIAICMNFLTFASYIRFCCVNKNFQSRRKVDCAWKYIVRSFQFMDNDQLLYLKTLSRYRFGDGRVSSRITWNPDVDDPHDDASVDVHLLTSVSTMANFYWCYTRPVTYSIGRPLCLFLNDWVQIRDRTRSLLPLRRAGCFRSRDLRRLLINHLSLFFNGGANAANSAAIVCRDEHLGVSDGISDTMELLPDETTKARNFHYDYILVQFVRALLTRSYRITYMKIIPRNSVAGCDQGSPETGFFMDIDPSDVDRLNTVFALRYQEFVKINFN